MKLNNLKIAPKLGIVVGLALLGLCAAGVLASQLMQQNSPGNIELLKLRTEAAQIMKVPVPK